MTLPEQNAAQDPHGHVCQGGCGGRLHGKCGNVFDDIETHNICRPCVTRIGKRKATAADGAGAGPSERQKDKSDWSKKGGSRARTDNNTKLEILKLLDAKVSQVQIADRFGCSKRFVRTVKADRKKVDEGEDEEEGSDDDNTRPKRRAPLACCAELSPHFSVLEAAADESGNGDAAFFLTKAKIAMNAAHSAKRVRQADVREFVSATP